MSSSRRLFLAPRRLFLAGLLVATAAAALETPTRDGLAAAGAAIAAADPVVAAARRAEPRTSYRRGFDIATGIFGDPALGGWGSAAVGPGSRLIREGLNAAGRRGFDASMALHARRVAVDAGEAAALISQYRAAHGLPPVVVDPTLMLIAADHARRMADADRVTHVLPGQGSFAQRLADGNFRASLAVENIAGGPDTVAEALALWRRSPRHDRNLLAAGVSKLGIAVARAADSRYETYWSLILGAGSGPLELRTD